VICAKLEVQVLKVNRFSLGWFASAARLVGHIWTFAHHGVKHNDFCCFKGVTCRPYTVL